MKIRFRWEVILTTALVFFIGFILYIAFVRLDVTSQLVSEHYYEEGMRYQDIINERNNADALSEKVYIEVLSKGIKIHFPKVFRSYNTKGNLNLLRPSNKLWDVNMILNIDPQGEYLISEKVLKIGEYVLLIRWDSGIKKYFIQQPIIWKH